MADHTTLATHPQERLRMGLIGGGGAGFIGKVHATAAALDRHAELVAGAFSSNAQRSRDSADYFGVSPDRAYGSYVELLEGEAAREDGVQFVSIATPNFTHAEIAIAAMEAGLHVICDKPMTTNEADAQRMVETAERTGRVFALTHNYSGYPLVRQAREMVAAGDLGDILGVRVSYVQGWMHGMEVGGAPDRGAWKSDPEKNGQAGSLGDVGTHAYHLLRFITGLQPEQLMCEMKSYAPFHQLDDYGHAVLRFAGGATGLVTYSQVSHGRLNDLEIEIDGSKAALAWRQEEPNQLVMRELGKPTQLYERDPNAEHLAPLARNSCRIPSGHPEAFFEAFANVYRDAFVDMRKVSAGESLDRRHSVYPSVYDGLEGVQFMSRCLASREQEGSWISF